jgi:hypothetical protein
MSSTSNAILTADSIWLDGKVVPWAQGQVPIMTHALHYGLGVFEGSGPTAPTTVGWRCSGCAST